MKNLTYTLLIILMVLHGRVAAQESFTLEECCKLAAENYPKLKSAEISREISRLNQIDVNTAYLPSVHAQSQVTWQSDVTKVDIPNAPFTIPSLSKDQYRISVDIRQNVWDGGVTQSRRQLEESILQTNLNNLEVELYRLYDQVSQAFFAALTLDLKIRALEKQSETIEAQRKKIESGIRNGTVEPVNASILEAEQLQILQSMEELTSGRDISLNILSLLTGKEIPSTSNLKQQERIIRTRVAVTRPELRYFDSVREQMDQQAKLTGNLRNPKIFGFGQAGFGKPGLNMLKNEFEPYLVIGAGISWSITDWGKTKRAIQLLDYRKQNIEVERKTFLHQLELLRTRQWEEILRLERQLQADSEMVILRRSIARDAEARLNNGTITAADFLRELNLQTIAAINQVTRRLQIDEAYHKYLILSGLKTQNQH